MAAKELVAHPLADQFPVMQGPEYEALKRDIEENGQKEPIVLFEGKILDGRNRYRACSELGIRPKLTSFPGTAEEAARFSMSANLMRRNLTKSQQAMILVLAGMIAPPETGGKRRRYGTGRDAIMEVGRRFGVNHMYLYKAAAIAERDPTLANRVRDGELSLTIAEKTLEQPAEANGKVRVQQPRPTAMPKRVASALDTREQFSEMEKSLSLSKRLLKTIRSSRVLPGDELSRLQRALNEVWDALKRVKPQAICDECKGEGCDRCGGRGWVAERR